MDRRLLQLVEKQFNDHKKEVERKRKEFLDANRPLLDFVIDKAIESSIYIPQSGISAFFIQIDELREKYKELFIDQVSDLGCYMKLQRTLNLFEEGEFIEISNKRSDYSQILVNIDVKKIIHSGKIETLFEK